MKNTIFIILTLISVLLFTSAKSQKLYNEQYRPQYHISPQKNYQESPCGLIYYDGEYHLFFQYNPEGKERNNLHWGHSISTDLVHWSPLPVALSPKIKPGENNSLFSGSAIVDKNNLLGKQKGNDKTLLLFYTSEHYGQCIAYSNNKGRTWTKYEGNPVIPHNDIDDACSPKVIWHAPSKSYVMVIYRKTTKEDKSKGVSFYTSKNLTNWKFQSHIYGFSECPDLISMNVTNRPEEIKWVLFNGDGTYIIGNFDGKEFSPETARMRGDFGKNFFASQTWSNIPDNDGRIIQIAWMRDGEYPDMPFTGQMTFPVELELTKFKIGYQLTRKPIKEINKLHGKYYNWKNKNIIPGINQNIVKKVKGDCLHIQGEFDIKTCNNFGFLIRHSNKSNGTELLYDVRRGTISILGSTAPLLPINNKITLDILIDRASIEVYANNGQVVLSNCFNPQKGNTGLVLFTNGGELLVNNLDIYKVDSIWK